MVNVVNGQHKVTNVVHHKLACRNAHIRHVLNVVMILVRYYKLIFQHKALSNIRLTLACGWCDDNSRTGLGRCLDGGDSGPSGKSISFQIKNLILI